MMNREGMPSAGENFNDEHAREFNQRMGRETTERIDGDAAEGVVENTLGGVTSAIRKLGGDESNRTTEVFSRLVQAADLSQTTKEQLISGYKDGDDFGALVDALGSREGEAKEKKRKGLIEKIKSKLVGAVVVGLAVMIIGGAAASYANARGAKESAKEAPVKITEEAETDDEAEDEPEVEEEEVAEEEGMDLDKIQVPNSDYENYDLDEIGDAVVERYIDTGEGYEESENGVMANFSDYNDFENKTSEVACNTPVSDEALEALKQGDRSLYLDEMMTKLSNNPANAASHLALIEPAMDAVGVPDEIKGIEDYNERAQAVWSWVREQGGEANKEMLAALFVAYKADTTELEVTTRTGDDWTMYETVENADEPISIENALLKGQARIERDEAVQVVARMHFTDKDNNEITVEYTTNAWCWQVTGEVVYIIKNSTTQEETTVKTDLAPVEKVVSKPTKKEAAETTVVETPVVGTPATVTPEGEVTQQVENPEEVVKAKDAGSLLQTIEQASEDHGSVNVVDQSSNLDTYVEGSQVIGNNDGTLSIVDSDNNVVSVVDGKGEVEVNSGYTTPPVALTEKSPEEVKVVVNEGQTYTNDAGEQSKKENDEADQLMAALQSKQSAQQQETPPASAGTGAAAEESNGN